MSMQQDKSLSGRELAAFCSTAPCVPLAGGEGPDSPARLPWQVPVCTRALLSTASELRRDSTGSFFRADVHCPEAASLSCPGSAHLCRQQNRLQGRLGTGTAWQAARDTDGWVLALPRASRGHRVAANGTCFSKTGQTFPALCLVCVFFFNP